jgi:hypothetical protein
MNVLRMGLFLILSVVLPLGTTGAGQAARFTPPYWIEVQEVSTDMVLSGLSTGVVHLVSQRPVEAVLDYFRVLWLCGEGNDHCRLVQTTPWSVLSRLKNDTLEYIQIRDFGPGATGYLASSLLRPEKVRTSTVPHPPGSRVLNDQISRDPGKNGRVLMVGNDHPVLSNATFYEEYFQSHGWRRMHNEGGGGNRVLVFFKGNREAHLVITGVQGGSRIVINLVQ